MSQDELYQWIEDTSQMWQGVSRFFKANVVQFSRGVAYAQSSHIRRIAGCVPGKPDSQRRRLQRFLKQEVKMTHFFQEWTGSLVNHVAPPVIQLVVDETKIGDQFGVMVVGMVMGGRCIPVAWRAYIANSKAAYPAEGQTNMILGLLAAIQPAIPPECEVRILADRGIGTSPALMRGIMHLGWTFLFRVTRMSKMVFEDGSSVSFFDQVHQPGETYYASGCVFKQRGKLPAHVCVVWGVHARQQWALVTNDPTLTGWEYTNRMSIEQAFRDLKSHGWQLQQVHFTCPQRLERFWIILVVAYAWLLFWGLCLDASCRTVRPKFHSDGTIRRQWSLFREGWLALLRFQPSPGLVLRC